MLRRTGRSRRATGCPDKIRLTARPQGSNHAHYVDPDVPVLGRAVASATGTSATGTPIDRLLNAPEKLLFASTDLDEVRSMVGRVMKPHQLTRTAGGERLDARMHYGVGRPVAEPAALRRYRAHRAGAAGKLLPGADAAVRPPSRAAGSASIPRRSWPRCSAPNAIRACAGRPATTRSCCASRARWSSARWSAIWAIRWTSRCISSWASAGATARPGAACCPIWWIAPPNIPTWSSTSWCCRRSSNWPPRSC